MRVDAGHGIAADRRADARTRERRRTPPRRSREPGDRGRVVDRDRASRSPASSLLVFAPDVAPAGFPGSDPRCSGCRSRRSGSCSRRCPRRCSTSANTAGKLAYWLFVSVFAVRLRRASASWPGADETLDAAASLRCRRSSRCSWSTSSPEVTSSSTRCSATRRPSASASPASGTSRPRSSPPRPCSSHRSSRGGSVRTVGRTNRAGRARGLVRRDHATTVRTGLRRHAGLRAGVRAARVAPARTSRHREGDPGAGSGSSSRVASSSGSSTCSGRPTNARTSAGSSRRSATRGSPGFSTVIERKSGENAATFSSTIYLCS